MKDTIGAILMVVGTFGFMVSVLLAILLIPGAKFGICISTLSMLAAHFSVEM